jgi:hypothetical protein
MEKILSLFPRIGEMADTRHGNDEGVDRRKCRMTVISHGSSFRFSRNCCPGGGIPACHVVEQFRSGPSRSVFVDTRKPVNTFPNFSTSFHPGNPLVLLDYWFEVDPGDPSRPLLRTVSPDEDVWQQGNRVLIVNHETGARSLKLVNAPNRILALLEPLAGMASAPLHEITPSRDTTADQNHGLWVGEAREADPSIPGAQDILRVWLNPATQLPERIQLLSTGFPQVGPEVVMRDYKFSEFNANFPTNTFNFAITDKDLAPMGITRAELDAMDDGAISFEVTGEAGAQVVGTVQDAAGIQQVRGTVPFTFVHDQHGDLTFDLRRVDGTRRRFGVRFNNTDMWTVTSHLKGKTGRTSDAVQAMD